MGSRSEVVDRRAVVGRHAVKVTGIEPGATLSVGNGELCATVDVTGLQTFPALYPVECPDTGRATLLGTQSHWGWHSAPRPAGADLARTLRPYRTSRGAVRYVDSPPLSAGESTLDEGTRWLRANPHRLDLARIGLVWLDGYRSPEPAALGSCRQVLDLWTGVIRSEFVLSGHTLVVETACHPARDTLAFRIESPDELAVGVRIAFPYGSPAWGNAADWSHPGSHVTEIDGWTGTLLRFFDGAPEPAYRARIWTSSGAAVRRGGEHEILVAPGGRTLEVTVSLSAGEPSEVDARSVFEASRRHWPEFWEGGAALDLSESANPRAHELERRAVLSQYLTAIQCSGSLPPQETGLTCNSWRGRFHLEMHWWHAAHFALWGRPRLLRRSMDFYRRILPRATETARAQGYQGARWPKQVGPDGRESPSDIGPFLLWQQPHVIYLAELLRLAGDDDVVSRFGDTVEETARFMADFAESSPEGFSLGPPLIPAQESYVDVRDRARNPPYELAYWAWALGVAQQWRVRAGRPPQPRWDIVRHGMAKPLVRNGRYAAIAVEPFTVPSDHPSLVYALGFVPEGDVVEPGLIRETLNGVLAEWDWESTWGWDYPALAMTATRLGEPEKAIDLLLKETPKNHHTRNGHNYQSPRLPLYLPGNGGLLAALALMVGGGRADRDCPGFPDDGTWTVRHNGFVQSP